MKNEALEERIGQLIAETVNAAINSQLEPEQAIACFGFASKILMQRVAAGGGAKLDAHMAFAKGLAQMTELKAMSYN